MIFLALSLYRLTTSTAGFNHLASPVDLPFAMVPGTRALSFGDWRLDGTEKRYTSGSQLRSVPRESSDLVPI